MFPIDNDSHGSIAMSWSQVTLATASNEPVFVSNFFADVVFAASPAAALIVLLLLLNIFSSKKAEVGSIRRRRSIIVTLSILLSLHIASLVVFCLLPPRQLFHHAGGLPTYIVRLSATLIIFLLYLRKPASYTRITGLYLLLTTALDAFRIVTLGLYTSALAKYTTEFVLVGLQIAIAVVSLLYIIFEALVPRLPSKQGAVQADEYHSSTVDKLLFGWLWELLSFGKSTTLTEDDLKPLDYHPDAIHREYKAISAPEVARQFYRRVLLQYVCAAVLKLLGAVATLGQPLIIGEIINHLTSSGSSYVGFWLIVAMFLDQAAIALFQAHASHFTDQIDYRLRSFLLHKVFQRSIAPLGGTDSVDTVSSKALVYASTDVTTIIQGPEVLFDVCSGVIIVVVASVMLYAQIGIAFMAPLGIAILGVLLPILMGPMLARSERAMRTANEKRIQAMKQLVSDVRNVRIGGLQDLTAEQVTQCRENEIQRGVNFRRTLMVVTVVALSLQSFCVLAAFGFFSLTSGAELDYTRLFTSLSILEVMIGPLLSTLQHVPFLVSAIVSWKRVSNYINTHASDAFFMNRRTLAATSESTNDTFRDSADGSYVLKLDGATIGWEADKSILNEVDLTLAPGQVHVVSGSSASGKSTLLKCVLGEAQVHAGHVDLQTTHLSYCDQTPWFIPDQSLRDTITLDKDFDHTLYVSVIKCCCLTQDFLKQERGDDTIVDAKGSALSGGQRVRLALARALYAEPKLLILDEIFTGLDRTTTAQIAENIFGQGGYLDTRPDIAVLMSSTIVPPAVASYQKTSVFRIDSGKLLVVDNPLSSSIPGIGNNSVDDATDEPSKKEDTTLSGTSTPPTEAVTKLQDITGEYGEFFRSFGSWFNVVALVIGCLLWTILFRGSALWLAYWTSAYEESDDVDTAFYVGVYAALTFTCFFLLLSIIWLFFVVMMRDSGLNIHKNMFATFLHSPASVIEKTKAQIINRFTQDISQTDLQLPFGFINFTIGVSVMTIGLLLIGLGAPYSLILAAILAPPLWMLQKHYLVTSVQLRTMQLGAHAPIMSALGSSIDGRLTLRAFSLNDSMMVRMSDIVYHSQRPAYLFRSLQSWLRLQLALGNLLIILLVTSLLVGFNSAGELDRGNEPSLSGSVAWGGIALLNAIQLTDDIKLIIESWTNLESSMGAMKRVLDYIRNTAMEQLNSLTGDPPLTWPARGEVQLDDLTLAYSDREVVRDVSLKIPSGTKLAILGRTGSGKTSLMQSFFGLIRIIRGSISVDGINLSDVNNSLLRSRLVGNPQQTFSNGMATVRRNLDPSQTRTDDDIRTALEQVTPEVSIQDGVMSMLESKWEDCNFSMGWQRLIGLARMMLRDSAVYVLDEPTSGMDEDSHDTVMDCIFKSLPEKTVIVITHTLKGIEKFDSVAVMADGELVEHDSPAKLLKDPSSQLYRYVHNPSGNGASNGR